MSNRSLLPRGASRDSRYRNVLFVLLFSCLPVFSGCVVVPLIDSVSQMGLSQADRERLLPREVKRFHDLLYWGKPLEAIGMVKESERAVQAKELERDLEGVRVVESKVDRIEFLEGAYSANVFITVKRYKVPFYVVEEVKQEQRWEFTMSDGWRYVSKTPLAPRR